MYQVDQGDSLSLSSTLALPLILNNERLNANSGEETHAGAAFAIPGDLDGNGTLDLVLGAPGHESAATLNDEAGGIYIIRMTSWDRPPFYEPQYKSFHLLGTSNDNCGFSLAAIGDVDMDGVPDIAVGCPGNFGKGGKVLIVTLTMAGGVKRVHTTIESGTWGFKTLSQGDGFGSGLAFYGNAGGEQTAQDFINLAVGSEGVDDGHVGDATGGAGAVFFFRLSRTAGTSNLSISSYDVLSQDSVAYNSVLGLSSDDQFGISLGFAGDVNGDGAPEIVAMRKRDLSAFIMTPKLMCLAGSEDRHYSLAGSMPGGGNWTACAACPANMFKATDSIAQCSPCPTGRTTGGLQGQTKCWIACPPGKFSHPIEDRCLGCALGKYNLHGGIALESQCTLCEAGSFGNQTGLHSPCKLCPKGYWNDLQGQSKCRACDYGKFTRANGTVSGAGCQKCPKNTYWDSNTVGTGRCKTCAEGRYTPVQGSALCALCEEGTIREANASVCHVCQEGTFADAQRKACEGCGPGEYVSSKRDKCERCPAGTFNPDPGSANSSFCRPCPRGTWSNAIGLGAASSCLKCDKGRVGKLLGASVENSTCTKCKPGRYKNISGDSTTCDLCERGKYSPAAGQESCLSAPSQMYTDVGWSVPRQCPPIVPLSAAPHCNEGRLELRAGYFCLLGCDVMDKHTFIVPCGNPDACLQPNISWNGTNFKYSPACAVGYEAQRCMRCAEGYGRAGVSGSGSSCTVCPPIGANLILIALFVAICTGAVYWIISRKSKKHKASLTRIFWTYLQFHSFASFLRTDWPVPVIVMYSVEEALTLAQPDWISMDCAVNYFFPGRNGGADEMFKVELVTWWGPLTVYIVLAVIAAWMYLTSPEGSIVHISRFRSSTALAWFVKTAIICEWLMWSSVMRNALTLYKCDAIGGGDRPWRFLSIDPTVPCDLRTATNFPASWDGGVVWDGKAKFAQYSTVLFWNAVAIFLHLVLFPAFLLWILAFTDRNSEDFDYRYGFLLAGYRKGVRWWEITVLARRLAVVCTIVFLNEYQQVQIATAFLILLIALFAHMLYRPYAMNEREGLDEKTSEFLQGGKGGEGGGALLSRK